MKKAHGELNRPAEKLASVLYDGLSEIENRATMLATLQFLNQQTEPSDLRLLELKNALEFVNTPKQLKMKSFTSLVQKFVYGTRLGLPLNHS